MDNSGKQIHELCAQIVSKYSDDPVNTAFVLIIKLLQNIKKSPNEPKFRQFKKSNEAIKTKVLVIKECLQIMKAIGYEDIDDEILAYKDPKVDRVSVAIDIIKKYQSEIEEKIRQRQLLQKNKEAQRLNDEINAKLKEEQRKKQEILKQFEYDKQERAKREKASDAVGNELNYGACVMNFKAPQGQSRGG